MTYIQGVVHSVNSFCVLLKTEESALVNHLYTPFAAAELVETTNGAKRVNIRLTVIKQDSKGLFFFYQKECLESLEVQTTCDDGALW